MENNIIWFVRYSSFVLLFIAVSIQAADNKATSLYPAIYYGDSEVNVGESFAITCIISISDPIQWYKDGETITKHNLRHGRDDHAYIETEQPIEGEGDKIEATIAVRHALSIHEGKYQCNLLHPNSHYLRVRKSDKHTTTTRLENRPTISSSSNTPYNQRPNIYDNIDRNTNLGIYVTDPMFSPYNPITSTQAGPINTTRGNQRRLPDFHENEFTIEDREYTTDDIDRVYIGRNRNIDRSNNEHPNEYDQLGSRTRQKYFGGGISSSSPTTYYDPTRYDSTRYSKNDEIYHRQPTISTITNFVTHVPTTTTTPKPIKKDNLVANYDNVEQKLKVYDIKSVLHLACNITNTNEDVSKYKLTWEKNGTDVSKIPALEGRYKFSDQHAFTIQKSTADDAGNYTCSVKELNESKEFVVVANVATRLPATSGVVEGEKLTIHCIVAGTDPVISWKLGNTTFTKSEGRYILEEDELKIHNAHFIIEEATEEDRADYFCEATNMATEFGKRPIPSSKTFVRVKGKLAALWPFLGICAEVFILCAIILIYEKRRNKTELDESDTDQNTEQKKKRRNNYD